MLFRQLFGEEVGCGSEVDAVEDDGEESEVEDYSP